MKWLPKQWIVLFGGAGRERCLVALTDYGASIEKVVVPDAQSEKLASAVKNIEHLGFNVVTVSRDGLANELTAPSKSGLLSVGFPYIIPEQLLQIYKIALNIHPAPLPKYRGPTTGAYLLINNEKFSGATVHLMTGGADMGPIVRQSKVVVGPFDTVRSVQRKVYESEPNLLIAALKDLDAGVEPIAQDENRAFAFLRRRTPDDSQIDPALPLQDLINQIRACDPEEFPAYFIYYGEKVCIKFWRPVRDPLNPESI